MKRVLTVVPGLLLAGCFFSPTDTYPCRVDADCLGQPGTVCSPQTRTCELSGKDEGTSSSSSSGGGASSSSDGSSSSASSARGSSSSVEMPSSGTGSSSSAPASSSMESPSSSSSMMMTGSSSSSGGSSSSMGPNRAPVATDTVLEVDAGQMVSGTLGATDPDGNPLSFTVMMAFAHGTLMLDANTGAVTYSADPDAEGDESVFFTATDGTLTSAPARLMIRIRPQLTSTITWVGGNPGSETTWSDAANWSPATVPTADSTVLIPARPQLPMLMGNNADVDTLYIEDGATLSLGSHDLQVRRLWARGAITGNGRVLTKGLGASVLGSLTILRVGVDTTLVGDVTASGAVEVTGNGVTLTVDGNTLQARSLATSSNATLNMTVGSGRVVVEDDVTLEGNNPTGELSAGTLEVGRNFTGGYSGFAATGSHRTVFSGNRTHTISLGTHANDAFHHLEVTGGALSLSTVVKVNGAMHVDAPVSVDGSTASRLVANGPLAMVVGSTLAVPVVELRDASGTIGVDGMFSVPHLVLTGTDQRLKPLLGYQDVEVRGTATLPDGIDVAGTLTVHGNNALATLDGQVALGALTVTTGGIAMDDGDVVVVHRAADFNGSGAASALNGGTLEVRGHFTVGYNGLQPSAAHRVRLAGTRAQTVSLNNAGATGSRFQALEITNPTSVTFTTSGYVAGAMEVTGDCTLSATSGSTFTVAGDVTMAAGSSLQMGDATLVLGGPQGTTGLPANVAIGTLRITRANAPITAGRPYTNLHVTAPGVTLASGTTLSGDLRVSEANSTLTLMDRLTVPGTVTTASGGKIIFNQQPFVAAGDFQVSNAPFEMAVGDDVTVMGTLILEGVASGTPGLVGGVLHLHGDVQAGYPGVTATGSHEVRFGGSEQHTVSRLGNSSQLNLRRVVVESNIAVQLGVSTTVTENVEVAGALTVTQGVTLAVQGELRLLSNSLLTNNGTVTGTCIRATSAIVGGNSPTMCTVQ